MSDPQDFEATNPIDRFVDSRDPFDLPGRTMDFTFVGDNASCCSCVSIHDSRSLHDQSGIRINRFDIRNSEYANHHQYHVDSVQSANRKRPYLRPHRHLCQLGGSAVSYRTNCQNCDDQISASYRYIKQLCCRCCRRDPLRDRGQQE